MHAIPTKSERGFVQFERSKWCKKTMFTSEKQGKSGSKRSNSLYLNSPRFPCSHFRFKTEDYCSPLVCVVRVIRVVSVLDLTIHQPIYESWRRQNLERTHN